METELLAFELYKNLSKLKDNKRIYATELITRVLPFRYYVIKAAQLLNNHRYDERPKIGENFTELLCTAGIIYMEQAISLGNDYVVLDIEPSILQHTPNVVYELPLVDINNLLLRSIIGFDDTQDFNLAEFQKFWAILYKLGVNPQFMFSTIIPRCLEKLGYEKISQD